ncbi:MAG: nucleotidyltransferase [Candidatus Aenigmarchaeota archaeon]|nr:nucleotidyltransferase [Candidatus Aenigmarchaeota archaeon]
MTGHEEQLEIFKLIGKQLKKKTECWVIGGSAMLFYGFKTVTKDVDLVFNNEDERQRMISSLESVGFAKRIHEIRDGKAPVLMERKEERFDLFLNDIISTKLSPGMTGRIKEKHEFNSMTVNVVSPEDIIVLKCATDRSGDRKDAADIINSREINWTTILDEAKWQAANGKKAFVVLLFDFVMELKDDYKIQMPKDFIAVLRKEYKAQLTELLGKEKFRELSQRK